MRRGLRPCATRSASCVTAQLAAQRQRGVTGALGVVLIGRSARRTGHHSITHVLVDRLRRGGRRRRMAKKRSRISPGFRLHLPGQLHQPFTSAGQHRHLLAFALYGAARGRIFSTRCAGVYHAAPAPDPRARERLTALGAELRARIDPGCPSVQVIRSVLGGRFRESKPLEPGAHRARPLKRCTTPERFAALRRGARSGHSRLMDTAEFAAAGLYDAKSPNAAGAWSSSNGWRRGRPSCQMVHAARRTSLTGLAGDLALRPHRPDAGGARRPRRASAEQIRGIGLAADFDLARRTACLHCRRCRDVRDVRHQRGAVRRRYRQAFPPYGGAALTDRGGHTA